MQNECNIRLFSPFLSRYLIDSSLWRRTRILFRYENIFSVFAFDTCIRNSWLRY